MYNFSSFITTLCKASCHLSKSQWPSETMDALFSGSTQRERRLDSRISRQSSTRFWVQIGALGPPRCPRKTAWAKIAPPRESKKPIFDVSILLSSAGAWSDALIRGHLDKAAAFSGADCSVGTAEMPFRDDKGRNRPTARV